MPVTTFVPQLVEAATGKAPLFGMGRVPLFITSPLMRFLDAFSALFRVPVGLNSTASD